MNASTSIAAGLLSLALGVSPSAAAPATQPTLKPSGSVPYVDREWGGSADPCVIYNAEAGEYFIYYTQRRANLDPPDRVLWMHGSAIGIVSTKDGHSWTFRGVAKGDDQLGDPIKGDRTWWAPHVVKDGDTYHLFVTYVDGIFPEFGRGKGFIKHFTSNDGLDWKFVALVPLEPDVIDPCVEKIGDVWYMWYKLNNRVMAATSPDLKTWKPIGQALEPAGYEAPYVFAWQGSYWMIVDTMRNGCDVFKSPDGKSDWKPAGHLWCAHPAVIADGEKRVLVSHTGDKTSVGHEQNNRRTQITIQGLKINEKGELEQAW